MSEIWTRDEKQTLDHAGENRVTGTDVPGNKRGQDVVAYEDSHLYTKADLLIKGTSPQVNYDEIQKSVTDSSTLSLEFLYENQSQFFIDFTNAFSSTENVKFRASFRLTQETGDLLTQEDDSALIQEGA